MKEEHQEGLTPAQKYLDSFGSYSILIRLQAWEMMKHNLSLSEMSAKLRMSKERANALAVQGAMLERIKELGGKLNE